MQVEIDITTEPIDLRRDPPPQLEGAAGAWVEFQGVVRSEEDGHPIDAIHYEAYQPMAEEKMRQIADEIRRKWPSATTAGRR